MCLLVYCINKSVMLQQQITRFVEFVKTHPKIVTAAILFSILLTLLYLRVSYLKRERRKLIHSDDDVYENEILDDSYSDSFKELTMQIKHILRLRARVRKINAKQEVFNENLFGPMSTQTTVIVINMDMKLFHLKQLIASLKQVAGIVRALLIFAHDTYDGEVNRLIHTIDFAKFTQIFYPYSTQLHPNIFPGDDPQYCAKNLDQCVKANYERSSELAQMKLSWWWKMNQIFDHLAVTKYFNGYITFIDEDQIVTDDFIYMIKQIIKSLPRFCPYCDMISLGAYHPVLTQYDTQTGKVIVEEFGTTEDIMGVTFNRTFWNIIKDMRSHFCSYNDYDWINSVRFLGSIRPSVRFVMASSEAPRVFTTDKCGNHGEREFCTLRERMGEINSFLKLARRGLYPRTLNFEYRTILKPINASGGWTDARDRELCMFMSDKIMYKDKI